MQLNTLINNKKIEFDIFYKDLLNSYLSTDLLSKAMIYASMNGGKRIRPFLISIFSDIAKINKKRSLRLSASVESIHSYSLVHDDLPSMDNDDFRRGKPSTHKKFNEATAILAGDALHDLAFEIISDKKTHPNSNIRIALINKLSQSVGVKGLAGGQSLDLIFENKKVNISNIISMYEMKTAALFSFSCCAPFILSQKLKKDINFAYEFGKLFGLIFQITDDILDEKLDFKFLGKTPGKDRKQGKNTLISKIKLNKLKNFCLEEIKKFENKNIFFLKKYPALRNLLYYNLDRLI